MSALNTLAALASFVLAGAIVHRAVWRPGERPLLAWLLTSFALGAGAISLGLFLIATAGGGWPSWLRALPLLGLPVAYREVTARRRGPAEAWGADEKAMLAVVLALSGFVLLFAVTKPIVAWDGIMHGIKSRAFFLDRGIYTFLERDDLGWSRFDKPFLVPLSQTWLYMWLGKVDEALAKSIHALFFMALLCTVYEGARELAGRRAALVVTVLLAATPACLLWSTRMLHDVPLAFFLTSGWLALLRVDRDRRLQDALAAGVFLGLATFTKNEGKVALLTGALLLAWLLLRSQRDKKGLRLGAAFLLVGGLIALPHVVFRHTLALDTEYAGADTGRFAAAVAAIPSLLNLVQKELFRVKDWGLSLLLSVGAVLSAVALKRGRRAFVCLWLLPTLQFGAYVFVVMLSPHSPKTHLASAVDRLLLHVLPAGLVLLAALWGSRITWVLGVKPLPGVAQAEPESNLGPGPGAAGPASSQPGSTELKL